MNPVESINQQLILEEVFAKRNAERWMMISPKNVERDK